LFWLCGECGQPRYGKQPRSTGRTRIAGYHFHVRLGGFRCHILDAVAPRFAQRRQRDWQWCHGQEVGDASVILIVNGAASAPMHSPLVQSAPGILTIPSTGSGNGIPVFVDPADNLAKIAAPASASSTIGYPTTPIPRGSDAFFYAAGTRREIRPLVRRKTPAPWFS
jgi:uncharacterized protein (TIGR03437 family)